MSLPGPEFLRVTALAKRYGEGHGVTDVSLTVRGGEITGFIGVNGAGKSTTIRCILDLIRPDSGEIRLFGGAATREARRRVGFLPEERGLFPRDRARDAIAFHGRLKGMSRRDALASADRLLERIGLGDRRFAPIESLSKGNAQRVQILCALVHGPALLVLDEPLSGLDPLAQSEVLALFAEFRAAGGGILFSTHAMASAEALCDRVVILAGGRTAFDGPLAAAADRAPNGVMLVTCDHEGLLAAASDVGGQASPVSGGVQDAQRWRVVLPPHVTHPALLGALARHGVSILAFEPIKPNLEGAFWSIVRPEPPAARNLAA
jgi:ABC-2 type transport system ATP-binding protein